MNEVTAFFLLVWLLCVGLHVFNIGLCLKRWLPMKKGQKPQTMFIFKENIRILRIATIASYIAVVFFCVFFDVDYTEKAKLFAIILMIVPVQPIGLFLIAEYCFLFHQNRKYMRQRQGDDSLSPQENEASD